jgi:peptidoglycan/LPS O-acetylase OafA/YrhL
MLVMHLAGAWLDHQPSPDLTASIILPNLAMVQEWPVFGFVRSINVPSWSISVEVFLYIFVFPVLAYIVARHGLRKGVSVAILVVALAADVAASRDLRNPWMFEYSGLARGIAGFTAGFVICELIYKREAALIPVSAEVILGLAAAAMLPFGGLHPIMPLAFAALIAVTYSRASLLGRVLGSAPMAYLGALSYSVYIWQAPVIKACSLAFAVRHVGGQQIAENATELHKVLYCVGTPLALAVVANLSFYAFETPLRKMLRRRRRARIPVPAVPSAVER